MYCKLLTLGLVLLLSVSASPGGTLYAVESSRNLFTVDMLTGAKTPIGAVSSNAGTTGGLAYDRANNVVYLTSTSLDSLFTLDLTTGAATLVGPYGDSAIVMHGLEFDSSTHTLYGVSSHNNGLYNISQTTGLATLIGTSGLTSFTNLGYNSHTDVLYATNSATPESFFTMNRATGAVTLVGLLNGPTNPNGVAYNWDNQTMYMVDNSTDMLYTIDLNTGAATAIGSTGTGNLLGLVYIPEPATAACLAVLLLAIRRRA